MVGGYTNLRDVDKFIIKPIMNLKKFKDNPGMPIQLQICDAASTSVPQYIANKTARAVIAYDGYYVPLFGGYYPFTHKEKYVLFLPE